jgi:hypothetical protein
MKVVCVLWFSKLVNHSARRAKSFTAKSTSIPYMQGYSRVTVQKLGSERFSLETLDPHDAVGAEEEEVVLAGRGSMGGRVGGGSGRGGQGREEGREGERERERERKRDRERRERGISKASTKRSETALTLTQPRHALIFTISTHLSPQQCCYHRSLSPPCSSVWRS